MHKHPLTRHAYDTASAPMLVLFDFLIDRGHEVTLHYGWDPTIVLAPFALLRLSGVQPAALDRLEELYPDAAALVAAVRDAENGEEERCHFGRCSSRAVISIPEGVEVRTFGVLRKVEGPVRLCVKHAAQCVS